jgi:bud emergence protein 1
MVMFSRASAHKHKHSLSSSNNNKTLAKDPTIPPRKVIRALYAWDGSSTNQSVRFLAFAAGDFLHVTGRENDTEWYEAENPLLHDSRGLVPVSYFEEIGKTAPSSVASSPQIQQQQQQQQQQQHDSGYADKSSRMSKSSMGRSGSAPVYGVVAYDFKAERPDELEAHEGEAIIVIAQSNPEWFVAKPITRLGGPGLIPVSFVEIKDLSTGKTIDSAEAIARAGVPRVEEWKKMAAEYKNTSIPLGQIGGMQAATTASLAGLQSGMDRMSIGNNNNNNNNDNDNPSRHSRTTSNVSRRNTTQALSQHPLAPLRASVPRYMYLDEKFHFIVEVTLADGSHWDLTRIYEDFYELQINLIKAFPDEAGNTGHPRTLPLMPGPVQFVTDRITEGRRENLDEYLYQLLHLGSHIANSALVRGFFTPHAGDYEVDTNLVDLNEHSRAAAEINANRYSTASHASVQYATSTHSARQSANAQSFAAHQRQQSSAGNNPMRAPNAHYRTPSTYTDSTSSTTQNSTPPLQRQGTAMSTTTVSSTTTNNNGSALKVKVWFDRETCVVLRLPPRGTFNFDHLYRKILERRRLEYGAADPRSLDRELNIEVRNERTGDYTPLVNDDTLEDAIAQNDKMMLVVQSAYDG